MKPSSPLNHLSPSQRTDFNAAAALARCGFGSAAEVHDVLVKGKRLGGLDAIGATVPNTGENISLQVREAGADLKPGDSLKGDS